jgi:hypothetical protein
MDWADSSKEKPQATLASRFIYMPQTHKDNQEWLNEGHYSHCSFRSPAQAVSAHINPRSVLNHLFGKSDKPGSLV